MKFRHFLTATSIALLPLAASAATFIVPAAGSAPGANGSNWQSELTLHNSGPSELRVGLRFHERTAVSEQQYVTIGARSTRSLADVVRTTFLRENTTGAIEVEVADRDAKRLAIASRTFNVSDAGEFGQDIPAVNVTNAAISDDVNVLAAPSSVVSYRFNFGVYSVDASRIRWEVVRANGEVAGATEVSYAAGEQLQYNGGITSLVGVEPRDNDSLHAVVLSGRAIFYGSAVNNGTGDPTFVPGVRTRADITINFLGIDIDEDGTVDIGDHDQDGVLDASLDVTTSMYPSIFRIVAEGEFGELVTFQVLEAPLDDARLIDNAGTILLGAPGDLKNKTGTLRIRATAGGASSTLTIPIHFK